jgi:hypothetical protein
MDAQPGRGESRIRRGWRLTAAAWRLMMRDSTMIALAVLATVCAFAGLVLMLWTAGVVSHEHHTRAHYWVYSAIFVYPGTFLGAFFNVAVTAAAAASLEGRWIGVGGALREALERIRAIAVWTLLLVGVSVVLNGFLSRIPWVGGLVARITGAAWSLATIFAIPLLTLEDADPIEAARGSALLVKSKWGEGITGAVSIGAWTGLAMIPVFVAGLVGLVLAREHPGAGVGLIVLAGLSLVGVCAVSVGTRQVFNLALFRYASGVTTPGFDVADLERPFTEKKEQRRRRTRKWAWIALGLIVAFLALGAFLNSRRHHGPEGPGFWYVTYSSEAELWVSDGMPVIYKGHRVGSVFEHWDEDGGVRVGYYVAPGHGVPARTASPFLVRNPQRPFLRLVPPAPQPRSSGSTALS